jgi:ATP-dependent Clp protease ATP-binding subunit ClpB
MRMDKLTSRFQQALSDAQSLAVGRDHNLIEPAHAARCRRRDGGAKLVPAEPARSVSACARAAAIAPWGNRFPRREMVECLVPASNHAARRFITEERA